jgi:glycosyltransferase involved in cell wall biosynthesis
VKHINFISNQDLNVTSGGWSGINFNIHRQLKQYFKINYIGPISPKVDTLQKVISKLMRTVGLKSKFSFFSNKRLSAIKAQVMTLIIEDDYNFFFGQTPWVNCQSKAPYGVYLDADFKTYLSIFSKPDDFSSKDIERIAKKEEMWLQQARDIFVGSEWAWKEMIKYYDLKEVQKVVVHTGGNINLPEKDNYNGSFNLVFISLNFEKKGGFICVDAFKKAKEKHPKLTLTIIGEKPPNDILAIDGLIYAGLLRKTEETELKIFKTILSDAFLLIHPTKMDTMGAVLIEAGYFGCPSIAPNSFGVPELVLDNKTGFILDVPFDANDFSDKIELLIEDKHLYNNLRENTWNFTRQNLTWESIGLKIRDRIQQ